MGIINRSGEDNLLPCPFCGRKAAYINNWSEMLGMKGEEKEAVFYQVSCGTIPKGAANFSGCGARVRLAYNEKEAIKIWNTRHYGAGEREEGK